MFYLIIIFGVILDLFTKNLAFEYLQKNVNIFGDLLYLQYFENTGVAFSTQIPGLKYLTIILIFGVFYYYYFEKKTIKNNYLLDLIFGLILAGAIGNGIGRISEGKVIDFIGVKYFSVFNLADSFITIGAIIYLYLILKSLVLEKSKDSEKSC